MAGEDRGGLDLVEIDAQLADITEWMKATISLSDASIAVAIRKRNRYFNGTMAIAIGFPSGLWISPDRPKVPYGYLWGSMP